MGRFSLAETIDSLLFYIVSDLGGMSVAEWCLVKCEVKLEDVRGDL